MDCPPSYYSPRRSSRRAGLAPLTALQLERKIEGLSLFEVAAATGGVLNTKSLSEAERGLRVLTPEQEAARVRVLKILRGRT